MEAEARRAPARAAARERYFQWLRDLAGVKPGATAGDPQPSPSPDRHPSGRGAADELERAGMTVASDDDDLDRTLSSSLGMGALEAAGAMMFKERHSGSSGPPYTEGGTTNDHDLGGMAA